MRTLLAIFAMSFQFLIAPRVQVGDAPRASDMAGLSEAANKKDRSGLGDFHYRLCDYCLNFARQFLNSDETGNTQSMGGWWESFAYLNPKEDIPSIPDFGPGEPEGSNVNCPPVVFQFGSDSAGLADEEDRLGLVNLWLGFRPAETLEEWWEVGKQQRGVYDPNTGEQNVPSIEAARSAQNVQWPVGIPHGKTTGGFFPTPVKLLDDCDDGTRDVPSPSYQIKFTALRDDVIVPPTRGAVTTNADGRSVITFAGTCAWNTLEFGGNDIQEISRGARYYLLVFHDGIELLSRTDWLEGPYDQDGQLTRYNAEHFDRMIWAYVNDFRGTPTQRNPDTFNIQDIAFDFQAFNTKQYLLAPNIGYETSFGLSPAYPSARVAADTVLAADTLLTFRGQPSHAYTPGFVFTGCFAKATNLSGPVSLQVLNGKAIIATLTLTAENPQALVYVADAVFPDPLSVKIVDTVHFSAPGEIVFEATELLEYKPDHWDAYMLLRLSNTFGGEETQTSPFLDGGGIDCDQAAGIYKNYLRYGCVANTFSPGIRSVETAINESPVYDANRRLLLSLFRMVRRQELLSYEYDSLGRPVVRAKRWAFGLKNIKADLFEGIAPDYRGVAKVESGIEYVVRSHTGGTVNYNSHTYGLNQRFVGIDGIPDFIADGDALVLEYEGIKPLAPKSGWSNEWLMSEEFHFEHPSPTSLWYPDHYADWYVRGNRCHTYAQSLASDLTQLADLPVYPGGDPSFRQLHLSPETPSGWNYVLGANANASPDFCSSCQIYKAPYELASATVEFDENGNDVVRLVFKEPFQRDPSAATSFGPDPLTWNMTDVRSEAYRTTDNGLREYFYYLATGTHGSWKVGDGAYRQSGGPFGIQSLPDNPFGCIFPRLFFTSLAKKPYLDGNDTFDAHDTRVSIDELFKLEVKLKCWCEGAIDSFASVSHLCASGFYPFDFTYENLKLKAFGGANIGAAHGPMVNTNLDALPFNQIAACLDELNMFRLPDVMEFQVRELDYETTIDAAPTWGTGACPENASIAAIWEGAPPTPALTSVGAWISNPSFGITASSAGDISMCGPSATGSNDLGITGRKTDFEYRYVANVSFANAIPPILQDLIDNGSTGIIAVTQKTTIIPVKQSTTDSTLTACSPSGGANAFFDFTSGSGFYFADAGSIEPPQCGLFTSGLLTAGAPPSGALSVCSYADPSNPRGFTVSTLGSGSTVSLLPVMPDGMAIIVVPMVPQEAAT